MEFASLDLRAILEELQQLEEGFVQKVYQRKDELSLEIYVPGDEKKRLVIGTSYCFLSDYKRDNPERPPGFCMELRKHLGRVDNVQQRGFDRILEVKSGDYTLVCELFGKGNFVLLEGDKVIGALRQMEFAERKIVVGEEYEYPEPANNPYDLEDPFEVMSGELVRTVASDLSLGGTYAEEVVARTGVNKELEIEELDEEQKQAVREALTEVLETEEDPVLYREEEIPKRASPFLLETYSEFDHEKFEMFSAAVDELFYTQITRERKEKQMEQYNEKREGLEQQLEQQQRKVEGLEKAAEQNRNRAELIYGNYQQLDEIKKAVEKGIEKHGWDEMERRFKESDEELTEKVNSFNQQEEFVSVSVEGESIKLEPGENLEAIASRYYDEAKKREQKMGRAREALEETEQKLEELEKEGFEAPEEKMTDRTEKRSKKWFEKYRWFYTSEDYLVCIGRDAQTNEMLAKKHMEKNDLYLHADFDGAPSVVLKDGQDAGEESIQEAAKAAVTFSKTWKAGIGADSVYYVEPDQVTKNPESGEYLPKGSFVIRGEREYLRNVKVEAFVGAYKLDGDTVPFCGPESAIDEHCDHYLEVRPGRDKKSDIAKQIQKKLREQGHELDLDYIVRALPPGKSELV